MSTLFSFDLCVARRKSGLTQEDCAYLLNIQQARLSRIERGRERPTLKEVCLLSVIYDRRFEGYYAELLAEARCALRERIESLPMSRRDYAPTFNRTNTIKRLHRQLSDHQAGDDRAI